ncbi:MAG: DNA starvation/stationary phase protection protein [Bacteroidia bacterium]|nr:DNA starvation/stationary phase protection protein [Bacteroidia bacterium]NND25456.1 DNA starvation/stationary phase protection protein [Flavobacteriaceae bacterium]NNK60626.1 DNA starvation/stationary phase protection protein [Flavobacteriaceae bacterium]
MDYLNIKDDERMPVVVELNKLLADYHIYYQKLRNFHWNILGKSFFDLHIKFEELYTDAQVKIDEIAERILTLRFHPMSNLSDYLNITSIEESSEIKSDLVMVTLILKDHKKLLTQMSTVISKAEEAKDEGTIDLIGAYIRDLEKASWMLDAWSKKASDKLNQEILQS